MTGITRRDVIKAQAVAAAAAAAGLPVPVFAQNLTTDAELTGLRWAKAPCRFCGTGCSVMVATKSGRVVATHGDAEAEVNRGLNCVKGYFLSKIMYGEDRLTTPLLRMRDGAVRQGRRVHPDQLGRRLRHHGGEVEGHALGQGAEGDRHVRLGAVDDLGGLCRLEADEGGVPVEQPRPERAALHGERGDRLHADLRHRRADGLLRRHRGRRRLRALGREHGGDAPDPLDADHRPPLQLSARQGRGALDVPQPLLRPRRPADRLQAADRPRDHELHREPHHRDRRGQRGLRRGLRELQARQREHRLRPQAREPAGAGGRAREGRQRRPADQLRGVCRLRLELHARQGGRRCRAWRRRGWSSLPRSTPTRTSR